MRFNLCEIIDMPGSSLPFSCALDEERLRLPAIKCFVSPPLAEGVIRNSAGALDLSGAIRAQMVCVCDRCTREFPLSLELPVEAKIGSGPSEECDPDIFPLEGDWLDLSDLLETSFILSFDAKLLCKEDCAGLCPFCGKSLEDGPCGCKKEIDPRLAALGQLLDKNN